MSEVAVKLVQRGEVQVAEVSCSACEDGWMFVVEQVDGRPYDRFDPCPGCGLQRQRAKLLAESGIPLRFGSAVLGKDTRPHQLESARALWRLSDVLGKGWERDGFAGGAPSGDALLCGPTGTGKTHLICGFVRRLVLDFGVPARYASFSRLLREAKARMDNGGNVQALLGDLARAPVLALDELGAGRITDWELDTIHGLVSDRYDAMRPTIWATNYIPPPVPDTAPPGAGLEERMGEHAVSRILGGVTGRTYRLVSEDLRQAGL